MHEPVRPRFSQAEQMGLPPSHRVLLFRQFLQAIWIFLRFGLGGDVDDRGVAPLLDVDPKAEGGDGRSIAESTCVRVRKQVGNLNHLSPLCSATRRPSSPQSNQPNPHQVTQHEIPLVGLPQIDKHAAH